MNDYETIRKLIRALANKDTFQVFQAEVTSVDQENDVCDVKMIENDLDLYDVRLKATIDGSSKGILIVPTVGSKVLVGVINNNLNDLFIAQFSEVDLIQYDDGSFGGLVRADNLKTELDKTKAVVAAIKQSLDAWVTVPNDGGAALKTLWGTNGAGKNVGDYSNIENPKIKQGQ